MEKRKQSPGMILFAIALIILLASTCVKLVHVRQLHQETQEKLENCLELNKEYKQALMENAHQIQVLMEEPYVIKTPNPDLKGKGNND